MALLIPLSSEKNKDNMAVDDKWWKKRQNLTGHSTKEAVLLLAMIFSAKNRLSLVESLGRKKSEVI